MAINNIKNFSSLNLAFGQKSNLNIGRKNAYRCNICCDTGLVLNQQNMAVPCSCRQANSLKAKNQAANILPALANMSFSNFNLAFYPDNQIPPEYVKFGKTYRQLAENAKNKAEGLFNQMLLSQYAKGLMFQGQVGSGKTHLAAAIANALLQQNRKVLFLVVPDFLDDLRSSYGVGGEFTEAEIMAKAKNIPVLILDDLGSHNFSEWTQNKIFSLINHRLNYQLPTIITTNLEIAQLAEVLGARVVSRIIASCDPCLLPVPEDIRLIKSREA